MPQRHAKNNQDRADFTYAEKRLAGLGTQSLRLGKDSQLKFGDCAMSLQPAIDPVVSPSGHVYSRAYIYEYLLSKTKELKRQRAEWEAQKEADEAAAAAAASASDQTQVIIFEKANNPTASQKKEETDREAAVSFCSREVVPEGLEIRKKDIPRTSFWNPMFTPNATATRAVEPDKRPASPMSGQPLRVKDLVPIDLRKSKTDKADGSDEADLRYLCHVTQKDISTQPTVFLRNTGCVMLASVAKELAYPTMTCPITSKRFKKSDVIRLYSGPSAFSGSAEEGVTVKKYQANEGY